MEVTKWLKPSISVSRIGGTTGTSPAAPLRDAYICRVGFTVANEMGREAAAWEQ